MSETVQIHEDTWWTIVGAILAIIGCIFQAIGFIIQKIAHNNIEEYNNNQEKTNASQTEEANKKNCIKESEWCDTDDTESSNSYNESTNNKNKTNINAMEMKKKDKKKNKKYISNKLWLLGFFLNGIIGSLLNIIALNYAPQSVVLPLSATTLVGNTILATKYLNEAFPIQDFLGVFLVIIGSIGTIIVGPKEAQNDTFTVLDLKSQCKNISFLIFFAAITFMIIMDLILIQIFNRINVNKKQELLAKGIDKFEGKEIGQYTIIYCYCFYLISYPFIAAYCASLNFLVLKSFIQIIGSYKRFAHAFCYGATYIYVVVIFCINFLLEMYRQKGLRAFGAIYVIPIYQVFVITLGTAMGAIYFKEMDNMNVTNSLLFVSSVFVTCIGVIILALSNNINKLLMRTQCQRYLLTTSYDSDSQNIILENDMYQTQKKKNEKIQNNIVSTSQLEILQI